MRRIRISQDVRREVADQGFAWIPRAAWSFDRSLELHWQHLTEDWDTLEQDRYLASGARFRSRRYGRYYWFPIDDVLEPLPNEPYFQPEIENPYAGGIVRKFAALLPATVANPVLHDLVRTNFECLPVGGPQCDSTWEVRIHQIRITASPDEPGLPAPEGIHQDGTDFLTLHLIRRQNIEGGMSTIYDLERKPIQSYLLKEPLDSLILEDPRIMHGVTPVSPADGRSMGVRDILGVDFIYSPHLQRPV